MRQGLLEYETDEEVAAALHLAREVFGDHRQTPAVLADPDAFPVDTTRHICIEWDFIQGLTARLVRTLAARQEPAAMVYTFAAHDESTTAATPLTPDERRALRHPANPTPTGGGAWASSPSSSGCASSCRRSTA